MIMDKLLQIKNLKVEFYLPENKICAVNNANLEIAKNEVLVLAGESGSGKTITVLSITGILPPQAKIINGEIFFENRDLIKLDQQQLSKIRGKEIAYIFQEPTSFLNPVFNIGEQIAEVIRLHQNKTEKQARLAASELLDLVKIKHAPQRLLDYPHNLSGGMNQRVMIAMALACRPKLLIADEPTTSLDITTEINILKLLLELKDKFNFSILFITHNLSIASRIADRIAIMYKGEIVQVGDRANIFRGAGHKHTKELIFAYEKIGKI
jgi:ABC-type dipeptide/oligopeptide/nickel transport system ATPase component